jgi:hypothetical protein
MPCFRQTLGHRRYVFDSLKTEQEAAVAKLPLAELLQR